MDGAIKADRMLGQACERTLKYPAFHSSYSLGKLPALEKVALHSSVRGTAIADTRIIKPRDNEERAQDRNVIFPPDAREPSAQTCEVDTRLRGSDHAARSARRHQEPRILNKQGDAAARQLEHAPVSASCRAATPSAS